MSAFWKVFVAFDTMFAAQRLPGMNDVTYNQVWITEFCYWPTVCIFKEVDLSLSDSSQPATGFDLWACVVAACWISNNACLIHRDFICSVASVQFLSYVFSAILIVFLSSDNPTAEWFHKRVPSTSQLQPPQHTQVKVRLLVTCDFCRPK